MNYDDFINKSMSDGGAIIINKNLIHGLGLNETIILTELFSKYSYFEKNKKLQSDGSFFCTYDDLELTTCLAQKAQQSAIKKLKELGFINTKNKGLPSRRYFIITINQILFNKYIEKGKQVLGEKINAKEAKRKEQEASNAVESTVYPKEYNSLSKGISNDMPKNIISYPEVVPNNNKEEEQKEKQTNKQPLSVYTPAGEKGEKEKVDKDYLKLFDILIQLFPDYRDRIEKKLAEYQDKGEKYSDLLDTFNWLNSEKVNRINWYINNTDFSTEKKFNIIAKKIVEEKDKAKADIYDKYSEIQHQHDKPINNTFNNNKTPVSINVDLKTHLDHLLQVKTDSDKGIQDSFKDTTEKNKSSTRSLYKKVLQCFDQENIYIDGYSGSDNEFFYKVHNVLKKMEVTN
jgi:hypothetical protein